MAIPTKTLTERQIAVARVLATEPDTPKTKIADRFRIGRRTIYDWMKDPTFMDKIFEFEQSSEVPLTAEKVLEKLDPHELAVLKDKLKEHREKSKVLPELTTLEIALKRLLARNPGPGDISDLSDRVWKLFGQLRYASGDKEIFTPEGDCKDVALAVDAYLGSIESELKAGDLALKYGLGPIYGPGDRIVDQAEYDPGHTARKKNIEVLAEIRKEVRTRSPAVKDLLDGKDI
jgi:hypothetical protein